jgi:hypothetical protein
LAAGLAARRLPLVPLTAALRVVISEPGAHLVSRALHHAAFVAAIAALAVVTIAVSISFSHMSSGHIVVGAHTPA